MPNQAFQDICRRERFFVYPGSDDMGLAVRRCLERVAVVRDSGLKEYSCLDGRGVNLAQQETASSVSSTAVGKNKAPRMTWSRIFCLTNPLQKSLRLSLQNLLQISRHELLL